jgi:hypothetical protein
MDDERCPKCAASTVTPGETYVDYSLFFELIFEPDGTDISWWGPAPRWWWPFKKEKGVHIRQPRFSCCLACGHMWTTISPADLRGYIARYGCWSAKRRLEPFEKETAEEEVA